MSQNFTGNLQTPPSKGISYRTLILKNLDWSSGLVVTSDFGVSPSPFDLGFGTLDFGLGLDNI